MSLKTSDVLKIIGISSVVVASVAIPGLPKALVAANRFFKNTNHRDLGRIIKRLEKQEMISFKENGDKIEIEITEKGKRRLLEYDFEKITLSARRRDGKWRLVIFDIPEERKANRDVFRRKLLQLGMIRVQDSIFASAFPCKKEVDFLCHFLNISDFVTLVSLDQIERGEELILKEFKDWDN